MHQLPTVTVEFLDALKARKGFSSDYQLWKFLGWTSTTMSNYRMGRSAMGGRHAIRVASELGLSPAYVLACMEAERERNDQVAGVWRELAKQLRRSAAAIILIALGLALPQQKALSHRTHMSSNGVAKVHRIYILLNRLRALARVTAMLILSLLEDLPGGTICFKLS